MVTLPQTPVSLFFLTSFIPMMIMSDLWSCFEGSTARGVLAEENICLHKDNEMGTSGPVLSGLCHN